MGTRQVGRRAGIRQVAATAGVSMSTVSNVLNQPAVVAPSTRVVGCVVLDTSNVYYTALARASRTDWPRSAACWCDAAPMCGPNAKRTIWTSFG